MAEFHKLTNADASAFVRTNDPNAVLPLSPVGLVSALPANATVLNPGKVKLLILVAEYDRSAFFLLALR